eukprot:TRINITY_DN10037_c4_g1_i1.p1 TRINITY_DN10037_c4_g1~~TRINITY_DN10037_c4_g1_i1.p1  ORF type:complete len:486 (+),score=108.29 TRINITY_DN10037_c4_g1_i1:89-1546(+)
MAPKLAHADTHHFQHSFIQQNDKKIDTVYQIERRQLGEGSYGQVCRGKHKDTGSIRAIKSIDKSKISDRARFQTEVDIQSSLDHPNIVKLYEIFVDTKRYYLVMELCTGGELFDRIVAEAENKGGEGAFDEKGAATYMQQILGAMTYLHAKNFVHRDIKPENFLLQSPAADAEIKVIDFGLAKEFEVGSDQVMATRAGTPYYVAPQVLAAKYDEKCDIWSCGVIAYILLCGYPPFYGDSDNEILKMVKKGDYKFISPDWDGISDGAGSAKDLIRQMLTLDPTKRPSAAELLSHPWITSRAAAAKGKISKDLGSKLRRFNGQSRMKKVALTLIAQQLKDEDLEELRNCFISLDSNKDGTLTLKEVQDGMLKSKLELPADMVDIMKSLDTDSSGCIDYTEFIAATLTTKQYLRKEVMWAAFRTFDKDGDGQITKAELAATLKEQGDTTFVENMINEVDLDGDGVISFEEFEAMLASKHPMSPAGSGS